MLEAFLLASWLSTQSWCMDTVVANPPVTHYRVYWGANGGEWRSHRMTEVAVSTPYVPPETICVDTPEPVVAQLVFFVATAFRSSDGQESITGHGPVDPVP